jgi:hypothetical protein
MFKAKIEEKAWGVGLGGLARICKVRFDVIVTG